MQKHQIKQKRPREGSKRHTCNPEISILGKRTKFRHFDTFDALKYSLFTKILLCRH